MKAHRYFLGALGVIAAPKIPTHAAAITPSAPRKYR